ncbi:hypothetical protein ACPV5Z_26995, partial [Vibrio mediterranei]|uniref:hypothetical protein n=1 Tax=Vibrio mediterranei TaxID=689 RepID=UPI0040696333
RYTDWVSFKLTLEEKIQLKRPLRTADQLNHEVKSLTEDIQKAAWLNTPTIRRKIKGNNYPAAIKQKVKEKRAARQKWQQSR